MSDDLKASDLINIKTMHNVRPKTEPKIDELVSKAVGKQIYTNNPKLIAKLVEWKTAKGDSEEQDNFLEDPKKVEELKAVL